VRRARRASNAPQSKKKKNIRSSQWSIIAASASSLDSLINASTLSQLGASYCDVPRGTKRSERHGAHVQDRRSRGARAPTTAQFEANVRSWPHAARDNVGRCC
jgi:hypothetical protein